jgi:hypothetical protein
MMKIRSITALLTFLCATAAQNAFSQTFSTSTFLTAQPVPDRTILYNVTDSGVARPFDCGLDCAWISESNMIRGIAFMGAQNVKIVRASFQPTYQLVNGDLQQHQIDTLNIRLGLVNLAGKNIDVMLNDDPVSVASWYSGNAANWAALIDATTRRVQASGHRVVSVAPFNEPDYGWGQGSLTDFYNIAGQLKSNARFDTIRICGGNTLNDDKALSWYNSLKSRLDEGNTHQLAGSFANYASFFQAVRANGHHATADEMHNVMDAMVGVEYGLQTGIWWGTAEYARGEFVKASNGRRLGYAEHRDNWSAASVYRTTDGHVQAFGGTSERQAVATTYRFVSKDRDVYYEGYGPTREYTMSLPGGTGYQTGQSNAERVVNVSWGEDVQPAINGIYKVVNRNSGKSMEVAFGNTNAGASIQQYNNTGKAYQQWAVTPVKSTIGGDFSYFTFIAQHNKMALDMLNFSLKSGTGAISYTEADGVNQQWYLEYAGDGYFYIRNRNSSLCLAVYNASKNIGVRIVQMPKDGSATQQWRLLPVDATVEFVAPSAPADLTAEAGAESIRLTWSASPETDVAGYTVLRADTVGGSFNTIARGVRATSFVDNSAVTGQTYAYKVRAEDKSLNRSECSNTVTAATTGERCLVEELPFENSLSDTTANLNHASSYGTIAYVDGKIGSKALSFNGTDAFVQLPYQIADRKALSISTWVYWTGATHWQRIFDFGNGTDQYMFLTPFSGNTTLRFALKNGDNELQLNTTKLTRNAWVHLAVTIDADKACLYVDGKLADSSTSITMSQASFRPLLNYIGRSQFSDPLFKGYIDDFSIFNYALTSDEVAALAGGTATAIVPSAQAPLWTKTEVFDLSGRQLLSAPYTSRLQLLPLPAGTYIVKHSNSTSSETLKIVK